MKPAHTFVDDSAAFDEGRIVSGAGLVSMMMSAEQTRPTDLLADHAFIAIDSLLVPTTDTPKSPENRSSAQPSPLVTTLGTAASAPVIARM
ncbi:hypothetical protein [Rhodococcus sp. 27YEA15]|uniref:hypothetical protein n=1 Tax=Rhodococcus sp. 27YEA15 TaxID=3156259 RepID=UPI003C799D3F